MLLNLQVKDKIKLLNSEEYIVHKLVKDNKDNRNTFGLGLDPMCPGNFKWYHEDGKPVTYWTNKERTLTLISTETIIDIIKSCD